MALVLMILLPLADDPVPRDDDVVAGPWGAVIIVGLIVATVLLLRSFTRHLKKVQPDQTAQESDQESPRE